MAPKEKKSKKQKQQEKEAELARLAEEQRLEEERLAKEKAEEEKLLAEERKVREKQELELFKELDERLETESGANAATYKSRKELLKKQEVGSFAQDEWAVFIACDPLPDVQQEADVNTFLTEWGEKPREGADGLDVTFQDCTLCTELIRALQLESAYAAARNEAKQAAWQHEIQARLKEEMQRKVDGATADFLARAEEFADPKSHLCQTCIVAEGCRYGLWVNLAKNPRIKAIDYAELSVSVELPKALSLASIAVRVMQYANDMVTGTASTGWMTLGGVIELELLTLPPPSKKIKGWTMRQVTEMTESVVKLQYPLAGADGSQPPPGSAPPLRISYVIDDSVILPTVAEAETFHVGYWEEEGWAQDEVSLVEFIAESRNLSFSSTRLTSLALLQPTHLELPYKKWILLPSSPTSATLHLSTQRFEMRIDVGANGCTLRAPDRPELAALLGVAMPASKLMLRLRACGINLQPRDEDALKLSKVTPKDAALEKALHEALVPLVPRYALAPSRWNQSRGSLKATVRLSPAALDGEPIKGDPYGATSSGEWPCLEFATKRAMLISALDSDATCNEAPLKGGVAHSSPLECLKADDAHASALEDLQAGASSLLYQDTVRQLFDDLRLFSFGVFTA